MASRYTTTPRYSRKDSNYVSIGQRNFLAEADKLTADIKSLYDDYNTLYKQDSERGGGIDVYRSDSSAWYDNVSGLDSSLQAKADDILKRVEYYKSYLDPEYYKTLTSDIGNIKSNGSSILSNAQSMRDLYSNFKDEGEYMSWLEEYKYLNQDANEVKREIDNLKSQLDNLTGGNPNNFTPEAHELAKQYEEKTAYYNQLLKDQEVARERADIINSEYTPESQLTFKGIYNKAMLQGIQNRESDGVFQFMTDDEKKIYRTYWERGDYQKAEDYFKELEPRLREGSDAFVISRIGEVPVLRSVMSVPFAAAGGLENLVNVGKFATGMTDNLEKSKFTEASAALRQSATDWMGDGVAGKIGGFLYNTAMSATDSVALGALLGPTGAAVSLGLNAASSATNDALEREMGDWQAIGNGIAAGVFEALFERISLGELDALKKAPVKSVTKEVVREAGINASEEMATELANIIYDSLANGEFSNYAKMREEGMSPEDALLSMGGDVLLAGASGAVMGAGFGAVGGARAKKNYSNFYNSISNDIAKSGYTGDADLVASGLYKEKLKEAGIDGFRAITDAEQSEVKKYRARAQLNHNLDELNFTMGANGRKEADLLDIGDRDPLAVATAFAARYKQGVNGSSIGGFDTAKYAVLSETEQKIAYNAGKMDAAQSLSKKTEGFRAEKQAKIDAENARIEAERQEAEAKKQKAIEAKEQATYKKMTPQMQENAEKYGLRKNGALAYAADYTGDKSDASIGKYTEDFIKAYNAGKKGTDISRVGLGSLTDGQRRRAYNAGKADIEQNAPKFSSADIKTTSGTTASSTVKQGSTKILADNSKAVANEISKIESPKMRQYAKDFKLGENGVKTYATAYNKSQNEGVYTQDFVAAYNVGKSGKDISEVKASSLTEAQKKQAYNAGKMDAIKATVDDKKSRTKTFANGSKVIVADQTKLTAEQKNIIDNFAKVGIKVYLADIRTKNGDSANGLYDHGTGIIYLSTNPRKALQFLAKHELTHFIEKRVGKQQYFDLMNTIFDSETFKKWYEGKGFKSLTEMEANKIEEYRKGGIELNKEDKLGAKKEILADFVGEMLFGGKNQISDNLFSELDDNHKKTFREWIGALIDRLKTLFKGNKTAEDEITKLEAKFKEMLKESLKSEAPGETNTVSLNYSAVEEHMDMLAREFNTVESVTTLEALQEKYDKVVEIWERLGAEINSDFLKEWNAKGRDKAFTIFKSQAGYKYNIELSTMCRKGVALFDAIDQIVRKEVMQELGLKTLGKKEKEILYDILKSHNFEIPCAICYVEQARQREGTIIKDFIDGKSGKIGWNTALKDIQTEMQKLGVDYTFPQLDRSVATEAYSVSNINMDANTKKAFYAALRTVTNKAITEYNKANGKNRALATADTAESIANALKGRIPQNLLVFKTLLANPNSRFFIDGDLLYSSNTTHNIASYHHDLYSLFNQQSGVAGYKLKQTPVVYWGDVLSKNWRPDTVRKGGGIRNQSNSDGQMYQFLDMVQMYIDLTAKGQYLQAYTKTVHELKLLGLSNAKINASLIPKVVVYKNADGSVDVSKTQMNAGLDEKGNVIFDNVEGINSREALMLLADGEYSKSVAGCCIAYSDKHLMKLLDDSRIQLIIGFHDKTNDPNKRYRGAMYAKNYNGLNEAKDSEGKTVHIGFNQFVQKAEKMFKYDKKNGVFTGAIEHNGVDYIANDIPRLATQLYLEYCEEKGYTPAYSLEGLDIPHHPNYYKLLADFGLYDSNGNYAPHKKVDFNLPDTVPYLDANGNKAYMDSYKYLKKELESELAVKDAVSEALADESSNGIIPQFKAAVSESSASLSYTPDEGVDNSNENDYNNYTSSDEYIREVTQTDRRFFPRKLANKTAFLEDGDIETVHLYCPEKVYTFVANGYMKGYISKSEKVSKLEARKRRYEKYDGNRVNVHRTVIDVWSEPVPNQSRRPIDDVSDARGGRRPNADDILSKDTSGSARKGNYERVRENTYSQEEVNEIIRQLREMYGYANSESSLSYTPADEQELTRMAREGEISAEEYGRRMLEMKERKSVDDIYAIARMTPEDLTTTPDIDRRKGEAKGDGESKFHGSIQRSSIFDETFKAEAKSDEFIRRYETITNKETLNKAAKLLDEGGEEFVKEWNNKEAIEMSPVDTAVGFILLSRYQDIGNYNSAIAVAEKLRKIGTVTGQNLQLFSITSRFDANMMQQWAQKELDKAFEEAVKGKTQKWIDKNKSKFELAEEDIDYIRTRTIQAAYLPNGSRDQAIRLAEISSRLQDKIPPNLGQSFKAWQRISMLLNPKTQIRNVLGNGVMVPAFIVSDWFGSAVDKAISKKTGVRTTGVAGLKATGENLKAVKQGMYESYDDFKRHINTKIDVLDRFSVGEGKSFNENKWGAIAKALNSMDRLTSFLLDFGDRPFYEAWFTNSLNNQMRLNNVTEPTLAMVEIAQEEALQRTWQDNNGMTQAVASIKKACNKLSFKKLGFKKLGLDYGLGDVLVKFTKTPANLTKAIYDFSPAAAISIATKGKELSAAISTGRATAKMQKDFVNAVGKAAAGTLLYTLFGLLYAMGRISGRSDDDKDVSAFEKYVQGIPEYSVKMFGKWWSYDWSQPIGAVPAIVANFMESRQQGDDGIFKSIWEAIRAGGEVLFEQSFMKSFQILFTADSFVDGLIEAVVGEATVPIPTILSQTANVFDPYRRSTYDNRSEERTILNKVKQKIPGLRNTLEVERDILGRETPNSQKNWFNAFFNPANTYTDTSTAVTDHVYELYQSTGEASAIPSKAPYDVTIKGVKHTFSIEERNEYQRIMGETSAQIIGELLNNESYMALSDEQKLAVIKSVYSYSQSLAKSEMGLAESYDVISGIKDITEDEYNAMSGEEIKAIADDYVLSSYYSISDFDNTKKATWFINKSLPSAINAAIKSGDMAKAQELIKSIEANIKSFGLSKKETNEMIKKSQSSIKSEITSYWKEKFIEAHKRGDNGEKIRIKQILVDTGLYGNSSDVRDLTNGWKKEK